MAASEPFSRDSAFASRTEVDVLRRLAAERDQALAQRAALVELRQRLANVRRSLDDLCEDLRFAAEAPAASPAERALVEGIVRAVTEITQEN